MKFHRAVVLVGALLLSTAAFLYGLRVGVYHDPPFRQIQALKHRLAGQQPVVVNRPPAVESRGYDWANDPIGAAFYQKVPPFLENILKRYERARRYSTADFPLPPARHVQFRNELVQVLARSMAGDSGDGFDWVVNTGAKRGPLLGRFDMEFIDSVQVEGTRVDLFLMTIHATGDKVPIAACFPARVPAPAVVAFSGHTEHGLRDLFVDRSSYQSAIALILCKAGFATVAVEKIDAGVNSWLFQRKGELSKGAFRVDDEFEAATTILAMGDYIIPARQLMANQAAVEWLAADARVDHTRIGAVGVSLGGWLTLHTAFVNSRIKAVANFGGMWSYLDHYVDGANLEGFEGVNDYSQLFPGVWRIGDQNRWVLAAAPLPMLIGYGRQDIPYVNFKKYFYPVIEQQYAALASRTRLEIHVHDGGHLLPADPVVDFFTRRLALHANRSQ